MGLLHLAFCVAQGNQLLEANCTLLSALARISRSNSSSALGNIFFMYLWGIGRYYFTDTLILRVKIEHTK